MRPARLARARRNETAQPRARKHPLTMLRPCRRVTAGSSPGERNVMPVSNLLVTATGSTQLHHFNDEVVVRLALPAEKVGIWMLIGRVLIWNGDGDQQAANARLTTDDGATVLDLVDVPSLQYPYARLPPGVSGSRASRRVDRRPALFNVQRGGKLGEALCASRRRRAGRVIFKTGALRDEPPHDRVALARYHWRSQSASVGRLSSPARSNAAIAIAMS